MLVVIVRLQVLLLRVAAGARPPAGGSRRGDHGQTTAEYALVLLGAAAVALLVVAWATKTDRIGKLFDFVLDQIVGRVK